MIEYNINNCVAITEIKRSILLDDNIKYKSVLNIIAAKFAAKELTIVIITLGNNAENIFCKYDPQREVKIYIKIIII